MDDFRITSRWPPVAGTRARHLGLPRPAGAFYPFIDWIPDVVDAARELGWDRFSLLAHSMGAGSEGLDGVRGGTRAPDQRPRPGPAAQHFVKAELKHFAYDQLDEALAWASALAHQPA